MLNIKVLGTGCGNCLQTQQLIQQVADEMAVEVQINKETDLAMIMKYGALSTPGVVIDERLLHAGGIPSITQIREWLGRS